MVGKGGPDSDSQLTLDDLLNDPLIRLVMAADKVDAADIQALYRNLFHTSQAAELEHNEGEGHLRVETARSPQYRSGVGIMLLNARSEVFVGRRIGGSKKAWQMPQGGINEGEEPLAAARRELREEIGTDNVDLLAESPGWLRYDLPDDLIGTAWNGRWRGQQQKWFAMRFRGTDAEINIATEHPEFSAWRWVLAGQLPDLIISFKRQIYLNLLHQFRDVEVPAPRPTPF